MTGPDPDPLIALLREIDACLPVLRDYCTTPAEERQRGGLMAPIRVINRLTAEVIARDDAAFAALMESISKRKGAP